MGQRTLRLRCPIFLQITLGQNIKAVVKFKQPWRTGRNLEIDDIFIGYFQ